MKANELKPVKQSGFVVPIRSANKGDAVYFIADTRINGKRKLLWRSTEAEARQAAVDAIGKMIQGDAAAADLTGTEAHMLIRAQDYIRDTGKTVDAVCCEAAPALILLAGHSVTLTELAREWVARQSKTLPEITIPLAVEKLKAQLQAEGKSHEHQRSVRYRLSDFAENFNTAVATITPSIVSSYLAALKNDDGNPASDRTRRNIKDALANLCKWLILHGYLAKGTNWMEGVQKYSMLPQGDIQIYTPSELRQILTHAQAKAPRWLVAFTAISAFSTIRHSEVKRLHWEQIELSDLPGHSFIEIIPVKKTKSSGRRRLIPISDTLAAWLKICRAESGPVVPVKDSANALCKMLAAAKIESKHNGLRHSSISYRVAQTGDLARIADESGNSVEKIKTNYLRRVKPIIAAEWFAVLPTAPAPLIPVLNIPTPQTV